MHNRFAGLLVAFSMAQPALAQPAPPVDPIFVAAKATFEAMEIEARRAIQRDLVWAAGFAGVASGEFGPLTFAAIRRFETGQKSSVNGVLDAAERDALAKAAGAARAKLGYRIETDKATGMRIGVPTALFTKRSSNASGSDRWQTADDKATLDLLTYKPEETLETLFEKGVDPKVANRKITYKLLRPDFFVITGETAGGKFYRRVEKGAKGELHAFSLGYDKGVAAAIDPLVVAIASGFEGFPAGKPASTVSVAASGGPVPPSPGGQGVARPHRITGIVVAEGKIVTALSGIQPCKTLALDGPARMMAIVEYRNEAAGLALVSTATPRAKPVPLGAAAATSGLLLQRDLDGRLLAAPFDIAGDYALAPVQEGGAGAALFASSGQLAGLVTSEPVAKYAIVGVQPVLRHKVASAAAIASFAGLAPSAAPEASALAKPRSAGEIAADVGSGVVSLFCGK